MEKYIGECCHSPIGMLKRHVTEWNDGQMANIQNLYSALYNGKKITLRRNTMSAYLYSVFCRLQGLKEWNVFFSLTRTFR